MGLVKSTRESIYGINGQFYTAYIRTGPPFAMSIPTQVSDTGYINGVSNVYFPTGITRGATAIEGLRYANRTDKKLTATIGDLPSIPESHKGYRLVKSTDLPLTIIEANNGAPAAAEPIPHETDFLPNFPNPFNPETWIPYQLSEASDVTITIYNMRGVVVRQLALGHQKAGFYRNRLRAAHWDGRNALGERVATGVYFVTFKAGEFTATRRMLILK